MIRDMKKIMMIMVLGALMACQVPAHAQTTTQEWRTTSSMQVSGSALAPQVTAVGAANVAQQATTTVDYSPNNIPGRNIHRTKENPTDPGSTNDENSPIGDAVLPLMLMAVAFCGYIALRRRKALKR